MNKINYNDINITKPLCVFTHTGFGDHVICNGMIRYFCKKNECVLTFCLSSYYDQIKMMFSDVDNLLIMPFDHDYLIHEFVNKNIQNFSGLYFIRHESSAWPSLISKMTFDRAFYELANLDFDLRFKEFYYKRNLEQELKVYLNCNPGNLKYNFVIDDQDKGYIIDQNKIFSKHLLVSNNKSFNIFDYIMVLENAEEIHVMQTGFLDLINSLILKKPKIFRHRYVRGYTEAYVNFGLNPIIEIF